MDKVLILYDKREFIFGSRKKGDNRRINIKKFVNYLSENNLVINCMCLHDLNIGNFGQFDGWYVVYPSCEDPGLFYKDFIEDILLGLKISGAILLPDFALFRSHHNKHFMEILRQSFSNEFKTIESVGFYGLDDLSNKLVKLEESKYPIVLKTSEGSGSVGVKQAYHEKDAKKKAKRMSHIAFFNSEATLFSRVRHWLGRIRMNLNGTEYIVDPKSCSKMIFQNKINELECDYKILVFGNKYYLLKREIRDNDFRASGSGRFSFPYNLQKEERSVLTFAKNFFQQVNAPMISVDVAYDGKKCHLIEFQGLCFGPYTLQYSQWYFIYNQEIGGWDRIEEKSELEKELARAIVEYINK